MLSTCVLTNANSILVLSDLTQDTQAAESRSSWDNKEVSGVAVAVLLEPF